MQPVLLSKLNELRYTNETTNSQKKEEKSQYKSRERDGTNKTKAKAKS